MHSSSNNNITESICKIDPIKIYPNADLDKARIILENRDKAGVYR